MPIMPPTAAQQPSYPSDRDALWRAVRALEQRLERPAPDPQAKTGVVTTSRPTVRVLGASVDRDVWRVNSGAVLEVGDEVVCVETALGLVVLSVVEVPPLGPYVQPEAPASFYIESKLDTTTANTYTFAGMNFGAPDPARRIHVVVMIEYATSSTYPEQMWIGGVLATRDNRAYDGGGAYKGAFAFFTAEVPDGTTGDVVVGALSLGRSASSCHISVYRTIGGSRAGTNIITGGHPGTTTSLTISDDLNETSLGWMSGDVPTLTGGWVIVASITRFVEPVSVEWSGVAEDNTTLTAGMRAYSVASISNLPAEGVVAGVLWNTAITDDPGVYGDDTYHVAIAVAYTVPVA